MKYLSIILLLLLPLTSRAQPIPEYSHANKRIFIKSNQELEVILCRASQTSSMIDTVVRCFAMREEFQIKDTFIFYDLKIYKNYRDYYNYTEYSEKVDCMNIRLIGFKFKDKVHHFYNDTISLYIEIPEFYNGNICIDVSKVPKNNLAMIPCGIETWACIECSEWRQDKNNAKFKFFPVLNITPDKYEDCKGKKIRKLNLNRNKKHKSLKPQIFL
jgi:hypothetical protein